MGCDWLEEAVFGGLSGASAGRGLRGRRAQLVCAAIGHALAFPTWHSLTHEQGLSNDDAAALMCRLVENA